MSEILMQVDVTGLGREPSGIADVTGVADGIDAVVRRGIHAVGLTEAGLLVAAIVPAADVHDRGRCCCQHCPWGGVHPGPHARLGQVR
jgi:hypothetical protein